jgi:alpha-beta hydrolase superfamily lysophospholipase
MELAKLVGDMVTGQAARDDKAIREALREAKPKQGQQVPSAVRRSASHPKRANTEVRRALPALIFKGKKTRTTRKRPWLGSEGPVPD